MWEKIERSTIIGLYCSISPKDCDELMALKVQAEADAKRNSELRVELEQVKKVANDQAQLVAQLQKELDALKKAVIWYDDADSASECRRAHSRMLELARKVRL